MIEVEAKPFPYRFDPARAALVVIDMQRDSLGNDLLAPSPTSSRRSRS